MKIFGSSILRKLKPKSKQKDLKTPTEKEFRLLSDLLSKYSDTVEIKVKKEHIEEIKLLQKMEPQTTESKKIDIDQLQMIEFPSFDELKELHSSFKSTFFKYYNSVASEIKKDMIEAMKTIDYNNEIYIDINQYLDKYYDTQIKKESILNYIERKIQEKGHSTKMEGSMLKIIVQNQ